MALDKAETSNKCLQSIILGHVDIIYTIDQLLQQCSIDSGAVLPLALACMFTFRFICTYTYFTDAHDYGPNNQAQQVITTKGP